MNGALIQLHRHKAWATLSLIEHCQRLDAEHLDAPMPGTYGTLRDTLTHLVSSDEDYLRQLTGAHEPEPAVIAFEELAERFRRAVPRWEELAADAEFQAREITASDGWRFPAAILMAQAVQHADEHRTQVLSILGARGLSGPRSDVWGYARQHDLLWPPTPPATG